jgi:hypothetical protein
MFSFNPWKFSKKKMQNLKNFIILILLSTASLLWSCKKDSKWKGQDPIKKVITLTRPIQYQLKKTYSLGNGIYCSNEFAGARLNGVVLTNDTIITVLITSENTPVNESPWYAFKIWSEKPHQVQLKITYSEGVNHRYYPKISRDYLNWNNLDSTNYLTDTASINKSESPKFCTMKIAVSTDTLWISAQEIITSKHIENWAGELAEKPFVTRAEIGKSTEGRPINLLQIGNPESKKMIMVLSRQHPPEVTGWLAMKWFVETLCAENEIAEKFRNEYNIFVFPLVNPDGVENGHWRHNAGGIDINRDWEDFNQPETRAIRDFMKKKVAEGGQFYFAVDFHSTFKDIYYTINPEKKGNMPGLVPELIQSVGREIPGYEPNIRPNSDEEPKISSTSFFFYTFGAEAVTYEIGDGTPRELIKRKGELTALKLMELMNSKTK